MISMGLFQDAKNKEEADSTMMRREIEGDKTEPVCESISRYIKCILSTFMLCQFLILYQFFFMNCLFFA